MRIVIVVLSLLMTGELAFAGECKARVEPMLDSNTPEDAKSVFELCKVEAAAGDPEALYYVSFFYFGFGGLEENAIQGVAATRASAEKGYAQAQYWMGWQHESGVHLPRDYSAALDWYERSAAAGFWMACDRLARVYRNGELGAPVDPAKADHFLLRKQRGK